MTSDRKTNWETAVGVIVVLLVVGYQFAQSQVRKSRELRCQEILSRTLPSSFDCRAWMQANSLKVYEDGTSDPATLNQLGGCAGAAHVWEQESALLQQQQAACRSDPTSGGY